VTSSAVREGPQQARCLRVDGAIRQNIVGIWSTPRLDSLVQPAGMTCWTHAMYPPLLSSKPRPAEFPKCTPARDSAAEAASAMAILVQPGSEGRAARPHYGHHHDAKTS